MDFDDLLGGGKAKRWDCAARTRRAMDYGNRAEDISRDKGDIKVNPGTR